jgi:hypothetical protein
MAACQQKRIGFRDAERNICVKLHWRMALAVYVETYSHTHTPIYTVMWTCPMPDFTSWMTPMHSPVLVNNGQQTNE